MTPEIATQLADHHARIESCEVSGKRVEERVDRLIFLLIATLLTSVAGLVVGLLKH